MTSRRATTLLELLIALGMFAVASVGLFFIFNAGLQFFRGGERRTDTQRATLLNLSRLLRELPDSSAASLHLHYPSGDPNQGDLAMSFAGARDPETRQLRTITAFQQREYAWRWLVYRHLDEIRLEVGSLAPTAAPVRLTPAEVTAWIAPAPGKTLQERVTRFQVLAEESLLPTDVPAPFFWIAIECPTRENRPQRITTFVQMLP